jgi:predicted DNA-binding protein (MmcQ/YjbR family)
MAKRTGKAAKASVWGRLREFALGLPGAWEDFPWGEVVIKVNKKVFVFLGTEDAEAVAMSVKLTDHDLHEHALSLPGAAPTGYGLGRAGWVSVPLAAAEADVLLDWIEESYRTVAPKKLLAGLDDTRKA